MDIRRICCSEHRYGLSLHFLYLYSNLKLSTYFPHVTASAVLPPSNPTNLVLTGAFGLSFLSYAAHTVLPALAAALGVFVFLKIRYKSGDLVPETIDLLELGSEHAADGVPMSRRDSDVNIDFLDQSNTEMALTSALIRGVLIDRNGALVGTALLLITLIVLVGTSPLRVPVWEITVPPALIMLFRDVWHDRKKWRRLYNRSEKGSMRTIAPNLNVIRSEGDPDNSSVEEKTIFQRIHTFQLEHFPTLSNVISHLPIGLIPFALCMFILVQALASKGWVNVFASWWDTYVRACARKGEASEVVGAVAMMMVLTALLCNVRARSLQLNLYISRLFQRFAAPILAQQF